VNRTQRKLVESGLHPETGKELTKEEQQEWSKKLNAPSPKKKKGFFRRLLGFQKGGRLGLDNSGQKIVQKLYKKGGKI